MTIEQFNKLEMLCNEVAELREHLSDLRNASAVSALDYSGSSAGGSGGAGDSVSRMAVGIADIEDKIMCRVLEMVEIIDTVPAVKTRRILRHRYINGWSWSRIADAMGYGEARAPRRRLKNFVKGVKNGKYDPMRPPSNGVK